MPIEIPEIFNRLDPNETFEPWEAKEILIQACKEAGVWNNETKEELMKTIEKGINEKIR